MSTEEDEDLARLRRALARAKASMERGATHLGPYIAIVEDCIARQEALAMRNINRGGNT